MPRRLEPPLTEEEDRNVREAWRLWDEHAHSEEYCLSLMQDVVYSPSAGAISEAQALVDEQIMNLGLDQPQAGPSLAELRAQKLSENAFVEHCAMQLYRMQMFSIWHVAKSSGRGPERMPTVSERLRFEEQFYGIYRLVIMTDDRFTEIFPTFNIADMVRLRNLVRHFIVNCSTEHKILAPIFATNRAEEVWAKIRSARDAKAKRIGLYTGVMHTRGGYFIGETWSIYDEFQSEIEYEFPENRNKRPPTPKGVYKF